LEYPHQVDHLFLDNCAHFTEQERQDILESYFPDLTPTENGDHLIQLWDMVSHLFKYFPWCFKDDDHKLDTPAPHVAVLHNIALDYLRAGKDYDVAYKAAFNHEKVKYIQDLTVQTTVLRWNGSILKSYTDRIFEYELNPNINQTFISADRNLRFPEMTSYIKMHYVPSSRIEPINRSNLKSYQARHNSPFLFDESSLPPVPEESGEYLIEAWKELIELNKKNEKPVSIDQINTQLALWFSNN